MKLREPVGVPAVLFLLQHLPRARRLQSEKLMKKPHVTIGRALFRERREKRTDAVDGDHVPSFS